MLKSVKKNTGALLQCYIDDPKSQYAASQAAPPQGEFSSMICSCIFSTDSKRWGS